MKTDNKNMPFELAVYGKGGIGKSTISANLSAALAFGGNRVMQIGCDPKHDSTRLLMHGKNIPTVLEYLKNRDASQGQLSDILWEGCQGIGCIEAGGPRPGVGCAGRGIISAFEFLEKHEAKQNYDLVVYDVLGDVVCGGFAVPVRREYADAIFLVTSGEYMALYAANNILRGIRNYDADTYRRVAGIIYNERKVTDEDGRVERFAKAVGLPVCVKVPRSNAFARAEEENRTLMELEGCESEKQIFRQLAGQVSREMKLYPARPLTDEELERTVLGIGLEGRMEELTDSDSKCLYKTEQKAVPECIMEQVKRLENSLSDKERDSSSDSLSENSLDYVPDMDDVNIADASDHKSSVSQSNISDVPDNHEDSATDIKTEQSGSDQSGSWETASSENSAPPARLPLYGCAFNGAATAAIHLTDALIIAHSPRACAFYTWQNISSPGRKNLFNRGILMPSAISPNFECTDMGQTEAVFGGMDRLRECVQAAMERRPGAVVVISSCVSGIIGDDIRSIEELSTPEIPVIAIHADGDVAGDYMEGIRMCLDTLADKLIDQNVKPEGRLVNLINETGVSNNNELNFRIIRGLLASMGIGVNCRFLGDATCAEVRNLLAAPLNILASDSMDSLVMKGWLMEKYGCQFMDETLPVGYAATARWLRKLGEYFDCSEAAEQTIAREEIIYRQEIRRLRPVLQGKRILMTTINANLDWLMETAHAVGMKFIWIGVLNYLRQDLHITNHPEYCDEITEEFDWNGIQEKINELKPDIVLSNYTSVAQEGDYLVESMPMVPVTGFQSALHIFRRWEKLFARHTSTHKEEQWKNDQALFKKYFA